MALFLALAMAWSQPWAQISFTERGFISLAQRALPSTGPGSALFNPAALSETHWAYIQGGSFQSVSGKGGMDFFQLAGSLPSELLPLLPIGLSAGIATAKRDAKVDGTSAVYEETRYAPALAVSWPARNGDFRVAAGAAFPIHVYNAFNVVEDLTMGLDVGLLGSFTSAGQRLRAGMTFLNVSPPEIHLTDNRGSYFIPGRLDLALTWESPGRLIRTHWEWMLYSFGEPVITDIESGIKGWEAEIRPLAWLGVKVERPLDGSLTSLGIVFRPEWRKVHGHLEANFGHGKFGPPPPEWLFGESRDEGLGYVLGLTLGAAL